PIAVAASLVAAAWSPIAVEKLLLDTVLFPSAVEMKPLAVVVYPMAVELKPLATEPAPVARERCPLARVLRPSAVAASALAVVHRPSATEQLPIYTSSHWVVGTPPPRSAAFRGYHISRTPGPVTGMTPDPKVPVAAHPSGSVITAAGVTAGASPAALQLNCT